MLPRETLSGLSCRFQHTFFIPGNHELWLKGETEAPTSSTTDDSNNPSSSNSSNVTCVESTDPCSNTSSSATDTGPSSSYNRSAMQNKAYAQEAGNSTAEFRSLTRNGGARDSVQKHAAVLQLCRDLGIHVAAQRLGRLCIVPLASWHHQSWDTEPDIPGVPRAGRMTIAVCGGSSWGGLHSTCLFFLFFFCDLKSGQLGDSIDR